MALVEPAAIASWAKVVLAATLQPRAAISRVARRAFMTESFKWEMGRELARSLSMIRCIGQAGYLSSKPDTHTC